MSITITINGHCADHEAVLELLEHVNEACFSFHYTVDQFADIEPDPTRWREHLVEHEQPDDREMDLTPPQGIERPSYWAANEQHNLHTREAYVSALVMWTREHITEGPISELVDDQLRDVYRDFLRYGLDIDQTQYRMTGEQMGCLRGAFRDATAGQVPL